MAKRVVLIKHEDSPGDDRAATWLAENGFELDWRSPYAGDSLEKPDGGVAGTVLYGGPHSIPDIGQHPFLAEEARWVADCMRQDLPVLGLCLGGQVIAHALGAEVGPGPEGYHEFGYYELFPTEEGRAFLPEAIYVTQAHFHEFQVPAGAVLLASSELYRNQAMRYGERTYALQCHPEITIEGFKRWQDAEWAPWGNPGVQPREQQDALAARHDHLQDAWFRAFLDKLFGPRGDRGEA
ncbi:MAG: hypothetical protein OEM59_12860 [Rhodospirillales bacterium]|nr:hypothetical protein [Rhodospirillales bacterium]